MVEGADIAVFEPDLQQRREILVWPLGVGQFTCGFEDVIGAEAHVGRDADPATHREVRRFESRAMPGIAAPVLPGEANGPEENDALSVRGREQDLRHEFPRELRPQLGVDEIGLAFVLEFENGGFQSPLGIGMDPNEPLSVRFADRHGQDRLLDPHLVREILREAESVKVERLSVIHRWAPFRCRHRPRPDANGIRSELR